MKNTFFLISILLLISFGTQAQTKTALLIGISKYQPPDNTTSTVNRKWHNLKGTINDVTSINEVLKAKFGFQEKEIKILLNEQADRESILKALDDLATKAKANPGIVIVIYYAGHGSQVKNSLSKESDKKDESMVPADAWKGALDIRDKELAVKFNKIVDNGGKLTVIYDSCHSGSISRGNPNGYVPVTRMIDGPDYDAKDASEPEKPEEKGALILSAAQDYQFAEEMMNEEYTEHGAFTYSLLQVLRSVPANASANEIYTSLMAVMKNRGFDQVPVLAGMPLRLDKPLFELNNLSSKNTTFIAVEKPAYDKRIELQGGMAMGINPNCELTKKYDGGLLKLKVNENEGLNKSIAEVIEGNWKWIKPGDLFEITKYAGTAASQLKIYCPEYKNDFKKLNSETEAMSIAVSKLSKLELNPISKQITAFIYYKNANWVVSKNGKITEINANKAEKNLADIITKTDLVYLNVPTETKEISAIKELLGGNSALEIVDNAEMAMYSIMGRFANQKIEYALVRTNLSQAASTLPAQSNFVIYDGNNVETSKKATSTLVEYALKIHKVNSWLNITAPKDFGAYPFKLGLRDAETNEIITKGPIKKGQKIGLVLFASKEELVDWDQSKRFTYVFGIDKNGRIALMFPSPAAGNIENQMPKVIDGEVQLVSNLGRKAIFEVDAPYGLDTYILLSTDNALPNFKLLEQSGIYDIPNTRGASDLSSLLSIGANTRNQMITPVTWSVMRLSIESVEK